MEKMTAREFRFTPLDTVMYGPGCLSLFAGELERRGNKRVLLLTGKTLSKSPLLDKVKTALGGKVAAVYDGVVHHIPHYTPGEAYREGVRVNADCIVSIGGSSACDTAKTVTLAYLRNGEYDLGGGERAVGLGGSHDHTRDPVKATGPFVPNYALSTTLSAGEYSCSAGIVFPDGSRHGCYDFRMSPRIVVLDPELTVDTPEMLWKSTGVRSLDHAVEYSYTMKHHVFSDALAARAIKLLTAHLLPSFTASGEERIAHRGWCQVAGWLSIYGGLNTRYGISHAMGHQLGSFFGVAHGVTSCICLPRVMRFMADYAPQRFEATAEGFGVPFDPANPRPAAVQCAERAAKFIDTLGVPRRVREAGVAASKEGLRNLVKPLRESVEDAGSMESLPSDEVLLSLLEDVY